MPGLQIFTACLRGPTRSPLPPWGCSRCVCAKCSQWVAQLAEPLLSQGLPAFVIAGWGLFAKAKQRLSLGLLWDCGFSPRLRSSHAGDPNFHCPLARSLWVSLAPLGQSRVMCAKCGQQVAQPAETLLSQGFPAL